MTDVDVLERATLALDEGRIADARAILDAHLAREPDDELAMALLREADVRAAWPPELRPDARHLSARPPARPLPVGVIILGALVIVGGIVLGVLGLALLAVGALAGALLLALAAGQVAAGVGLLRLRRWAWVVAIVVSSLDIVANVLRDGDGVRRLVIVVVSLVLVIYLIAVNRYFRAPPT